MKCCKVFRREHTKWIDSGYYQTFLGQMQQDGKGWAYNILGCFIVPKVFIFTSTVIFPISYVPQVNLNQKYWIKIEIYYGSKPIKVLYYELLRGK